MSVPSEILNSGIQGRRRLGLEIQKLADVDLPRLSVWNYEPCIHHEKADPLCEYRLCGGPLFRIQRLAIAWLYAVQQGILASMTGTGKTNVILGLASLLKDKGALTDRAIIIPQTTAVEQWVAEAHRFAPGLETIGIYSGMKKSDRVAQYVSTNWDVCVVGYHMMLKDKEILSRLEPGLVVADDVDPLRDPDNKTHQDFQRICRNSDRVIVINATPLQIRWEELYSASLPIGGFAIFGSRKAFERDFVRKEKVKYRNRKGRLCEKEETIGYKNGPVFKSRMRPIYIRHRTEDLDDAGIPDLAPPTNHYLDLYPEQRKRYKELQKGVIRLIKEEGAQVKYVNALAKFTYGAEICAGLQCLGEPDGPGVSVKLDWLMDKLEGDFYDTKIVVFSRFKKTIRSLAYRMRSRGMDLALVVGGQQTRHKHARQEQIDKFWNDPNCRVIVGTTAIERSLNLQVANTVVNFDMLLNPARMNQIVGRVRRAGSKFSHVFVHNLLTYDTQEERYLEVLAKRQALSDYVFDEGTELFDQLTPLELLNLIAA